MARWVRRRDTAGRVLAIANQKRDALDLYGVTRDEARRAAWAIERDGRRREGASAMSRVLQELGGGWSIVGAAYRFAPMAVVEEAAYRWFARNRARFHRFGVRPECEEAGVDCVEQVDLQPPGAHP